MSKIILILVGTVMSLETTMARPRYAVKSGTASCIMCHHNPAGGGPRNVYGKIYASRNMGMGKHTTTDLYSAEARGVGIYKIEDTSKNTNGFGIMSSNVAAAVPMIANPDGTNYKAIAKLELQNYAGSSGANEIYVRYERPAATGLSPKHILIGKMNLPFGLMTDEHKTYSKQQTNTSMNAYDFGGMISGDLTGLTHYDLSLTDGMQSGGGLNQDLSWATTLNLRQLIGPTFVGLSGIYTKSHTSDSTWAIAANTAVNLLSLKSTILFEAVVAKNYNDQITGYFTNGLTAYNNDIKNTQSIAAYARYDFDLSNDFIAYYKFDGLAPDKGHMRDYFLKHSFGFRYFLNSNMDIDVRHEMVDVKRADAKNAKGAATKEGIIILGHVWF